MDSFLQKASALYKRPWPLLVATAALTVFFGLGMRWLQVDNEVKSMLPKTERNRALTELYSKEENFGSTNAALVGVEAADIYSLDTLRYVKSVEDRLNALNRSLPEKRMGQLLGLDAAGAAQVMDGLRSVGINDLNYGQTLAPLVRSPEAMAKQFGWDAAFAAKVARAAAGIDPAALYAAYAAPLGKTQSLVSADLISYEDDALVAKKLVPDGELSPENVAGLRERVHSWDTFQGMLVSKDESLTAITVIIKTEDREMKALFNQALLDITKSPPPGIKVFVAGEPVITDHIGAAMMADLPTLIPIMALVLVAILFFCFRSAAGIVFPLLLTVAAVVWTFGLMGWLGIPLTVVSSMIPVLLMAIVSAYGIHQLNHYYEDPNPIKYEVLRHNARSVGLAILLSGLTVMIGFGSMVTLEFVPIRDFGLMTAFGDLVGVLAALFVLPALLLVGKAGKAPRRRAAEEDRRDPIARGLRLVKGFGRKRPGLVVAAAALVGVALAFGALGVRSDMDVVQFFAPADSIRVADKVMNQKMAGTKSLSVVLDSDLRDPLARQGNPETIVDLATPAVLQKIDQYAAAVKARFPAVTKVTSYADVLKKMNQAMNGNDPAAFAIPDDPALVSQYLAIFSGDTQALLTGNRDKLRVMVTLNGGGLEESHRVALWTQDYFDQAFRQANHAQVLVTGQEQISYASNAILMKGMLESTVACIAIVFALLLASLRNLRMSLVAILPIVLSLGVNFGLMGYLGMPLNTATAMVSSIGIGIGVDFSIHFITWYRRELQAGATVLEAVDRTIIHKGRAIVYNWLVIAGGFLVLVGSALGPIHDFGLLTAVCMTVTAAGALVVVPAVIRLLARRDYAFLRLGVPKGA